MTHPESNTPPPIRGGQGRSDAEVEQCGLVVGVALVALLMLGAGIAAGVLLAGWWA